MKQDDGRPAFPTDSERQISNNAWHFEGMTLLDYFAGKIVAGLAGTEIWETISDEKIAFHAYESAAAMVAEKRRREKE